ncbi:MAG: alpha/beta fold hydrolase [Planctomycetes bacterium]|nr:alpha/beta fold hydrolase [Planctomycetota bacterium]
MKILFLHGWQSVPGGVKPLYLAERGHEVLNPKLPDEDFASSVRIAQECCDTQRPDVIVGSSRGGAVAMTLRSGSARLVLMCPAWKHYGCTAVVPVGTIILHCPIDVVIPFSDSREILRASALPDTALWLTGGDHRLADPLSLQRMHDACVANKPTPD